MENARTLTLTWSTHDSSYSWWIISTHDASWIHPGTQEHPGSPGRNHKNIQGTLARPPMTFCQCATVTTNTNSHFALRHPFPVCTASKIQYCSWGGGGQWEPSDSQNKGNCTTLCRNSVFGWLSKSCAKCWSEIIQTVFCTFEVQCAKTSSTPACAFCAFRGICIKHELGVSDCSSFNKMFILLSHVSARFDNMLTPFCIVCAKAGIASVTCSHVWNQMQTPCWAGC